MNSKKIGKLGENIALIYLQNKRYKILDRNYFFKIPGSYILGEIDIIAMKDDIISFIEVKTLVKKEEELFEFFPEDKVNFLKKRKIIRTAENWLIKNKISLDSKWQIDIIAIEITDNFNSDNLVDKAYFKKENIILDKEIKINHFKNVFSSD
jgi:putative endonuclease